MRLKIISLNSWWGGELMPQLLEFLKNEAADIVCLQEVYNSQNQSLAPRYRTVEVIRQELGCDYADFAEAFIHDGPAGLLPNGNAIISRLPMIERPKIYLKEPTKQTYKDIPENWPIEPRVLQHVALTDKDTQINVFNLHGIWDLDGDNFSSERKNMRDKILGAAQGLSNVIICGDTNAKATNQAIQDIAEVYPAVFGPEIRSTFNMKRKDNPGYATAAVDLMFLSPEIKVIAKSVPAVDVSDHLPVIVEFELSK